MAEDDDDFTFPTTVVAVPEERGEVVDITVATPATSFPGSAAPGAAASSRLWPFAAPTITAATTTAAVEEEEKDQAPASTRREEAERERATVVDDDEDRMDMLWADGGRAKAEPHPPAAAAKPAEEEEADDERAAAVAEQERMDLLWESFNEELLLRRARYEAAAAAKQHGVAVAPGPPDYWYLCPSSTSDAESEEASAPRYGCAPTMLRASSRAGGAGQFYGSPRRRSRGGGWALLLRLFRRLFAADKAAPRRHGVHVP